MSSGYDHKCEDCKYCNLNKYYRGEWYCNSPDVSIFDLPVDPEKCFEQRARGKRKKKKEDPMKLADLEHCQIIDAICPYGHGCDVCRLHNDYEVAKRKSEKMVEKLEKNSTGM